MPPFMSRILVTSYSKGLLDEVAHKVSGVSRVLVAIAGILYLGIIPGGGLEMAKLAIF